MDNLGIFYLTLAILGLTIVIAAYVISKDKAKSHR